MSEAKRELNFELDLLPIISVLAVCICFLLYVAAWTPLGVVKSDQAFGETSTKGTDNPASVFAMIKDNGELDLTVKDVLDAPKELVHRTIDGVGGQINYDELNQYLTVIHSRMPQIKVAVVMPHHASDVETVIKTMDQFKKYEFKDVGLSPF